MFPAGLPRISLACIASAGVACGGAKHDAAISNQSHGGGHDMTAAYLCSIEDGGFRYPQMPCVVKSVGGKYMLAKLAGSQRFRGEVRPVGEGFSFDGEYYCPFGDCTEPMHGEFVRGPSGELVGRFRDNQLIVRLSPAPSDAAWGGTSYGGDAYGGFGYGGLGYGGSSYGMPPPPRNRRP